MTPERDEPLHTPELEALLEAASRRPAGPDPAAQERALAAFRAARDGGLHAAPWRWQRRGRDDSRPRGERRRASVLVKALIAGLVAAGLGGVEVAAGTDVIPSPFDGDKEPGPVRNSPVAPGPWQGETRGAERESAESSVGSSGRPHPDAAADDVAHRVHLAALDRKGVPSRGEAMERLEAAGGGPEGVRAFCEQLADEERKQTRQDPARGDSAKEATRNRKSAEYGGPPARGQDQDQEAESGNGARGRRPA
nr:hypothetical protein OG781_30030 [Streptomyces sp. NBC_00830]